MPIKRLINFIKEFLWQAATTGDHHFFFDMDSAPHLISAKEKEGGASDNEV